MPDIKNQYKLIPWILKQFHNFVFQTEKSAFIWKLGERSLSYTVHEKGGGKLADVDISLAKESGSSPIAETRIFSVGLTPMKNVSNVDKGSISIELKTVGKRLKLAEERFDDLYNRFFPRDENGLVDWPKTTFWEQIRNSQRSKDTRIDLPLSQCGLNCIFCSTPVNGYNLKPEALRLLQYEQLQNAALEIGTAAKPGLRLQFFSTDPIAHPDIVSLVKLGKLAGYDSILIYSAMMCELADGLLSELIDAGLNSLDVPFYGVTAEVHDKVVGRSGHFECLMKVAREAVAKRISFKVHSVAMNINSHELEKIPKFVKELGGHFYDFLFVRDDGCSRVPVRELTPRISDLPKSVRRRLNLSIPCLGVGKDFRGKEDLTGASLSDRIQKDKDAHLDSRYKYEFADKCKRCKKRHLCSGVFPPYLEVYGDEEFEPFS